MFLISIFKVLSQESNVSLVLLNFLCRRRDTSCHNKSVYSLEFFFFFILIDRKAIHLFIINHVDAYFVISASQLILKILTSLRTTTTDMSFASQVCSKLCQWNMLLLTFVDVVHSSNFYPVLTCGTTPSCPLDPPHFVTPLEDIFGDIVYGSFPKELLCAFLCHMNEKCMSFNQLANNECQMFRSLPYKIVAGSDCKFFQVDLVTELSNASQHVLTTK